MSKHPAKVLIVDDERDVREPLALYLRSIGFDAATADDGVEALAVLGHTPVDIVLTDLQMPNMGGMELLRRLREHHPATMVIIFTAYGTVETAVEAIKSGAYDYVLKPIVFEDIQQKIEQIVFSKAKQASPTDKEITGAEHTVIDSIIGASSRVRELKELVSRVAKAGSFVVIQGESGTGKELVARALHFASERKNRPFLAVNCAAIPEHLLESEFFGYAKGAFTGAVADKKGLFESASHGTLFLDEVAELPPRMQAKLLRATEEQEITPIGRTQPVSVSVTIVAASAKELKREVEAGNFREDLYFRLNIIEICVPSLRERKKDIPILAEHFLTEIRKRLTTKVRFFSQVAMSALENYQWPGNIRELRNVVERAIVMCHGEVILPENLPDYVANCAEGEKHSADYRSAVKSYEKELILKTLASCNQNKKLAAQVLGIGLSSLYRKLEEFEIN